MEAMIDRGVAAADQLADGGVEAARELTQSALDAELFLDSGDQPVTDQVRRQ